MKPWREEDGAILVEASIAVSILLIIGFGILNFAGLFSSTVDAAHAAALGARAGTQTTEVVPGDDAVLAAVTQAPGFQRNNVNLVVIYKAAPGQTKPPDACVNQYPAPAGLQCNVYRTSDFGLNAASLSSLSGAQGWPVSSRAPGADYLGVWMQVHYSPPAPLVWTPSTYSDGAVMRIEEVTATGTSTTQSGGVGNGTQIGTGTGAPATGAGAPNAWQNGTTNNPSIQPGEFCWANSCGSAGGPTAIGNGNGGSS